MIQMLDLLLLQVTETLLHVFFLVGSFFVFLIR